MTVQFALMPADSFNYLATKDWLDENERQHGLDVSMQISKENGDLNIVLYIIRV